MKPHEVCPELDKCLKSLSWEAQVESLKRPKTWLSQLWIGVLVGLVMLAGPETMWQLVCLASAVLFAGVMVLTVIRARRDGVSKSMSRMTELLRETQPKRIRQMLRSGKLQRLITAESLQALEDCARVYNRFIALYFEVMTDRAEYVPMVKGAIGAGKKLVLAALDDYLFVDGPGVIRGGVESTRRILAQLEQLYEETVRTVRGDQPKTIDTSDALAEIRAIRELDEVRNTLDA